MKEVRFSSKSAWGQLQDTVPPAGIDNNNLAFHLREAANTVEQYAKELASVYQQLDEAKAETQRLKEDYEDHLDRCAGEREEPES